MRHSSPRRVGLLLFGLAALISIAVIACQSSMADRTSGPGAEAHGTVYADLANARIGHATGRIYLPGVRVYLKEIGTGAVASETVSNGRGWYSLPRAPSGSYQLCWEAAGFAPGCTPPDQKIQIKTSLAALAPLALTPSASTIAGRIAFADGVACATHNAVLGIDTATVVTLIDAAGRPIGAPSHANDFGWFVMPDPGAAANAGAHLHAECDGLSVDAPVPGVERAALITLKNTGPRIVSIAAGDGPRALRHAAAGATISVRVSVTDAATRKLHYRWFPNAAASGFVAEDQPVVRWPLPANAGTYTMQVVVIDEAGGHATSQIEIRAGNPAVIFSGTVTDSAGAIIVGAKVSIGGVATTTNAVGYFFVQLPQESTRYVVNISHDGYALYSRAFFTEFVGARFSLARAAAFIGDPAKPIDVKQSLSGGRPGAELRLKANSLVDAQGHPAQGPVTVYLSTFDPTDPVGRMPGNFGGVTSSQKPVRLTSYGGVDVQIRDVSNQPVNLAAGKTATVLIPVDPAAIAAKTPPKHVAGWTYDETTALWQQIASATYSSHAYTLSVAHFTAIDVAQGGNDAACMRLTYTLGATSFPVTLNFVVPVANGGTAPINSYTVTSASDDVLADLPPNEPIDLNLNGVSYSRIIVNSGLGLGAANSNPVPSTCGSQANLAFAPNGGASTTPTPDETAANQLATGGFLDYYGLDDQTSADTYYAQIDPTAVTGTGTVSATGAAVTGDANTTFTSFFVPGDMIAAGGQVRTIASIANDHSLTTFADTAVAAPADIVALSTYQRVGTKTTLARFKSVNGYPGDPGTLATATYFNANDLALGRRMTMWKSGGNIFYYVTNFHNVEAARLNNDPTAPIATVAMEYSPTPPGNSPYTKFYVFLGGDISPANPRINNANLDGNGVKFVPRLCVTCHGGSYALPTLANQGNMGSRFITFDLASYGYSGYDPSFGRNAQEEAFRQLNQGVLESTNPSAAQQELISKWYGGGNGIDTAGTTQIDTALPAGWSSVTPIPGASIAPSTLYADVVRTSCRTCHLDRDPPIDWNLFSGGDIAFNYTASGFKQNGPIIQPYICELRIMPHALVTYVSFWSNSTSANLPNRLSELQNAGLDGFLSSYACPLN